jgi:N-hydroxyarylamine O-acetyltransferase
MLLSVRADGVDWLADAGFGAGGLLEPLPIAPGSGAKQGAWEYRVVEDGRERVLESRTATGWGALYGFTLEPQLPSDYVVGNHYTSTHPDSPFTRMVTAQKPGFETHWVLRGETLTERRADLSTVETRVEGAQALLSVLAVRFGLEFPAGTRFQPLHG